MILADRRGSASVSDSKSTLLTPKKSSNAILFEGGTPVFVDIDPDTLNIDEDKIEEKITERTKALMIVDIFGHPLDWDKILKLSEKYNLPIIEDSCEALGAEYKGQKVGKFGVGGAFAFYIELGLG